MSPPHYTLKKMSFCLKTAYLIYIIDLLTLNSLLNSLSKRNFVRPITAFLHLNNRQHISIICLEAFTLGGGGGDTQKPGTKYTRTLISSMRTERASPGLTSTGEHVHQATQIFRNSTHLQKCHEYRFGISKISE